MKTLAIIFALFISQNYFAQGDNLADITVTVDNIKTEEGSVLFGIYTENSFLKTEPKFHAISEIKNGVATVKFENIPQGTYAISCFHDLNGNKQMDFEPTGMPLEPYGISNNKVNRYGPPIWEDSKFELSEDSLEMNISLTR
jgi:uncharacterized protein (DUF2141 family)